jgi:Putative metallopeptidase domain
MEINLQKTREVLRSTFGRDSFVASFIKKVQATENCPTACIDAQGVMQYNPSFVEQFVTSPADLFCLVTHELMHPMFGHFVYQNNQLENIGADLVINSAISLLFTRHSGGGALFQKFYKPIGLEGLLRPGSDMHQSRYARLYRDFYESHVIGQKLSTGEVIQALKVLTPAIEVPTIVLLGEHRPSADGAVRQGNGQAFGSEALARIAEDLRRVAQRPSGHCAGFGEALYDFLIEVLKTHMSLKRALLDRFTTRQKVDKFRRMVSHPRIGVSPIPIQPSKRDFVLLAAGVPPFHYHNVAYRQATQERGLAVYLDVSGSVNQHLPEIIGLLRSLRTELKTIFLFSNKVVEVPFQTLLAGQVQTTYGTDFDCIAEHILANRFDKTVILTDGYASMTEENQEQLKARTFRALTVLFGGRTDSPEFEALGDVVQLGEITV